MKKRLLTVLLAVCLVLALGTVSALADDAVVTDVKQLESAIANAQDGDTITLGASITATETIQIPSDKSIVLDLHGFNITNNVNNSSASAALNVIVVEGELTILDSTAEEAPTVNSDYSVADYSAGGIYGADYYGTTVVAANGGSVVIENGIISATGNLGVSAVGNVQAGGEAQNSTVTINGGYVIAQEYAATAQGNGAELTVNGGVIVAKNNAAIGGNGTRNNQVDRGGTVISINGGTVISHITSDGYIACGVYHPQQGQLNITGGTIVADGGVGVLMRGGDANITGGTIIATGDENTSGGVGDANNDVGAYGVVYDLRPTYPGHEEGDVVHISGDANVEAAVGAVDVIEESATDEERYDEIVITGGTFSSDIGNYIQDGAALKQDGNGTIVEDTNKNIVARVDGIGFTDLAKAIAAAKDGDTVTLVKDVNDTISIAAGKSIVLDLAGKTLTSPSDSMVYGELTIEDSSNSTGTFVSDKSVSVDGGILTLESGTINIENDYGIYCLNDGTAIVNGGKIESLYAPLTGNNTTGDMNFTVNGGELTAQYGPAIYMPGQGELTITDGVLNGGISLRMGQVNISGGTIYATNGSIDSPSEFYNYSGNAWLPDALYVFNGTYGSENNEKENSLNINITGGEFICENGQGSAVAIYDLGKVDQKSEVKISDDATLVTNASDRGAYQVLSLADIGVNTPAYGYGNNENVDKVETAISGGNFSSAVDKEYLASGINAQLYSINNSNAPYSYYSTVEDAMQVAKPGDVVVNLSAVTSETMYEVKFDNNGTVATISVPDEANLTLPAPTRNGYTFGGWHYGNTVYKAGETVKVTSDMTFTAVWSAINIPDTYDIEIADAANGEVDTSLSNASAGSTITITATPDSGYSVASVTVTGPDGRVDVVRVNATTYTFKMPAGDVTVRVTFTDSDALPFTDVSAGQWFYDAVAYVYTNGMMEGDSATTFNPDGTMTRAMFWAVLGRIDGATITGANWADQAREWAMAEGVSDGTDPNGLVTREQMVTMLWRYAGEPESTASLSAYTDADSVSDWAETAMRWAIDEGIITGMTDTTLVPQGTATRAQCAAIFMRFDQM